MSVGVVNRRERLSTDTDDPMAGQEVTEVAAVLIPESPSVVSEPVKIASCEVAPSASKEEPKNSNSSRISKMLQNALMKCEVATQSSRRFMRGFLLL